MLFCNIAAFPNCGTRGALQVVRLTFRNWFILLSILMNVKYKVISIKLFVKMKICVTFFFNFYYWHIYSPLTRKRRSAVRARLGVAGHLSTTLRWGNSVKCLSQRHNKQTCRLSPLCPLNGERQAGKLWIPIVKSLVWPDSESNPKSTDPEADALYHSAIWSVIGHLIGYRNNCNLLCLVLYSRDNALCVHAACDCLMYVTVPKI